MSATLFDNIGQLVTNDPAGGSDALGILSSAAFVVESGRVSWVGSAKSAPPCDSRVDVEGAAVIPGFVDSHSHPVFAGDRSEEFAARMRGEAYTGGGIRDTVARTRAASESQLQANFQRLVGEFHTQGITTFEAKSGYGLTTEDELRSLAIASTGTDEVTFLGAHVVPPEFSGNTDGYVELVASQMVPQAAQIAKWVDVFCDRGAFDVDQSRLVLTAGIEAGLKPRIHANQLTRTDAVLLAVELDCASADHCTHLNEDDITALANSNTVATLLPGAEFSTRSQYPDARRLIAAGATVAIATDCNPGSSYTTSMAFCIALAVREMNLSPAEALWAATAGGAKALRRTDVGALVAGSRADFNILSAPSYVHFAYRPGVNLIAATYSEGRKL